jgi:hypothetical protein
MLVLEGGEDAVMERRRNAKLLMREYEEKAIIASLRIIFKRLEEERRARNMCNAANRTTERRRVASCEESNDDEVEVRNGSDDQEAQLHLDHIIKREIRPSEQARRLRAHGCNATFSKGGEIMLPRAPLLLN